MTTEPLFYLKSKTIYQRPQVVKKDDDGTITTSLGFPICTISQYVGGADVLEIFNESTTIGWLRSKAVRVDRALEELRDMIDGGEECRGRDSEVSHIIRILKGEA